MAQVARTEGKAADAAKDATDKAAEATRDVTSKAADTAKDTTAGKSADAAKDAAGKGAEMVKEASAKTAELTRGMMDAGARTATAFRNDLQLVQKRVGAAGEAQRETVRKSAEGTAEFSKLFMDVVNEQTKHNMQIAIAFSRAVKWDEMVRLQSDLLRASFERFNTLNSRYMEIFQGVMQTASDSAKEQMKKAA